MEWLNYHHLLYFWVVAREGSIAKATHELRLAQPTISGQIKLLEEGLGEQLFQRVGRRLVLTDAGRTVFRYADEIFSLGHEMREALRGRPTGRPHRLTVGIVDAMPKLVAFRLLEPAMRTGDPVRLIAREGSAERLLAELATFGLDLVLSDAPVGPSAKVKAFSHLLGESGITFFAAAKVAASRRRAFPKSLDGAPFLLPTENTSLRRSLDQWMAAQHIRPEIVAEVEDAALLQQMGSTGAGVFAAPTVIEAELVRQHRVEIVGRADKLRERFYAISVERKLKHPAVVAISESARADLFG